MNCHSPERLESLECPEKFKMFEQSESIAKVSAAMCACVGAMSKGTLVKSSQFWFNRLQSFF